MLGKLKSVNSILMIFEFMPIPLEKIKTCFRFLTPNNQGNIFSAAYIDRGIQFKWHQISHEQLVPKEGLTFWLSARHGVEKTEKGHASRWFNPLWPEGKYDVIPF